MYKYIIASLLSGVLFSLAWPTYGIPFFIFVAWLPLLFMQHEIQHFSKIKRKGNTVFLLSFLSFLIWNAVTTGWLYGSRNPDGSHSLPAVLLPVVLNSLIMAGFFWTYHFYKSRRGTYWGLAWFVVIWMCMEKLHLSWEISWPWLNLGNVFSEYPVLIQWYDTLGATGGSFWILLINVYLFYTIRIYQAGRQRKGLMLNVSVLAALIVFPMLISLYKYNNFNAKPQGTVSVALLQPDLDPYNEKYQKDSLQIAADLFQLAGTVSGQKIDFYIAPETALPGRGSFSEKGLKGSGIIRQAESFLENRPGSVLIAGISSHRFFDSSLQKIPQAARETGVTGIFYESYNTALQLYPKSEISLYHKARLVPAVEIYPYIDILKPLLGNIMLDMGGSTASLGRSEERSVFRNPYNAGIAAPVICYESVYGEFVTEYVKKGANFLAIITNDSWWGRSEGHRQLMSYARLRAIETRREIARAANSGISAHINALGEVEEDTLYEDKTVLPAQIKLYTQESFYVKTGDLLSRLCIILLGFLIGYPVFSEIKRKLQKR